MAKSKLGTSSKHSFSTVFRWHTTNNWASGTKHHNHQKNSNPMYDHWSIGLLSHSTITKLQEYGPDLFCNVTKCRPESEIMNLGKSGIYPKKLSIWSHIAPIILDLLLFTARVGRLNYAKCYPIRGFLWSLIPNPVSDF